LDTRCKVVSKWVWPESAALASRDLGEQDESAIARVRAGDSHHLLRDHRAEHL
jgi:hypothetical protein